MASEKQIYDELLTACKAVEWAGSIRDGGFEAAACPSCWGLLSTGSPISSRWMVGHAPDCALAAAIAKAEPAVTEEPTK